MVKDIPEKILIWGTGAYLKKYSDELQNILRKGEYSLTGFIDSDPARQGEMILGCKVYAPGSIPDLTFDEIVICTSKKIAADICRTLIDDYGIQRERIHFFTWFLTVSDDMSKLECPETGDVLTIGTGADPEKALAAEKERVKVFDCFPFYNELDILEIRLELLYPVVDYFVLVELDQTHRWEPKELFYQNNRYRYKKYLDKIIYVNPVDCPGKPIDTTMDWTLENFQRNSVTKGLLNIAKADDIVLVSDVDEMPDPKKISELQNQSEILKRDVFSFSQDFFYYYFDFCHRTKWNGSFVCTYKNLSIPQRWRDLRNELPEILDGGWHLSYFGGADMIKRKIKSTVDSAVFDVSDDEVKNRIRRGADIFGRKESEYDLQKLEIDELTFPNIKRVRDKYPHLFWSESE